MSDDFIMSQGLLSPLKTIEAAWEVQRAANLEAGLPPNAGLVQTYAQALEVLIPDGPVTLGLTVPASDENFDLDFTSHVPFAGTVTAVTYTPADDIPGGSPFRYFRVVKGFIQHEPGAGNGGPHSARTRHSPAGAPECRLHSPLRTRRLSAEATYLLSHPTLLATHPTSQTPAAWSR